MHNLRPYFLLRFIIFGILFGTVIIFLVVGDQRESIIKENTRIGKAISESLVAHGEYGIITANREILESLVVGLGSNKDILYAAIVDTVGQNRILAEYNNSTYPLNALKMTPEKAEVTVRTFPGEVVYLDIITPYYFGAERNVVEESLYTGEGTMAENFGTGKVSGFFRMGFSIKPRLDELSYNTGRVCLVVTLSIFLFSLYYYYHLTKVIVKPLKIFLEKTRSIRSGDLKFSTEGILLKNEIGELGRAFEETVRNLKIAIDATRISEERLGLITASAKDGIIMTDLTGQILFMNPAFRKIFGISGTRKSEKLCSYIGLCRKECADRSGWGGCPKSREELESIFKARAGSTGEYTGKRYDGGIFPLELSLSMAESGSSRSVVVGVVRDITRRKAAERELRLLSSALKQTEDMVVVTDLDWRIEYVNPGFSKVTGYSGDESIGRDPCFISYNDDTLSMYDEIKRVVSGGKSWRGRLVNRTKSGALFEEDVSAFPLIDDRGEPVSYIFVKQDVTAKVQLERTLLQTRKMEAIGKLAGGIAHDFNNILTSIRGFAKLAMDQMPKRSREEHFLQCVLDGADRGADLIKLMLNFGSDRKICVIVDLEKVVKESIMLLKPSLNPTIEIEEELESGCAVLASEAEMHQVIMNICTNSIDSMARQGGVLKISTETVEIRSREDSPHVNLPPGKYVRLGIKDSGEGMESDVIDRVFEPFFTSRKDGKGTGLGLYTTHRIVDDMKGGITIHSVVGEGTLFNVYLHFAGSVVSG